jgi:hypothetical protein
MLIKGLIVLAINYIGLYLISVLVWLTLMPHIKGVRRFRTGLVFFCDKIWFLPIRFTGITFGKFMFIKVANDFRVSDLDKNNLVDVRDSWLGVYKALVYHEYRHTNQEAVLGLLFFILYFSMFMVYYIRSGDSRYAYLRIWFEVDARRYAIQEDLYYNRRMQLWAMRNIPDLKKRLEIVNKYGEKIRLLENLLNDKYTKN